jgi:hypothetical protein
MANLLDLWKDRLPTIPLSFQNANSTPAFLPSSPAAPTTQTLPNGGGTFNASGGAKITSAPVFTGSATPVQPAAEAVDMYAKYRDPKTGNIMSPEEYSIYLGNKVPKGAGDIPTYAGDAMTNPDASSADLTKSATNLNNTRNDIATGTTDPYKVGSKSGIAYSPTELAAIEKAYAGIYDPALNDVFARLKEKQVADAKIAAREEQIFQTNENIRQWRATTGSKGGGGGGGSSSNADLFTQTQLNTAARKAGVSIAAIEDMDADLVNFFIDPPKVEKDNKNVPIDELFEDYYARVESGELTADQVGDNITESPLPEAVKTYFIDRIPAEPEKKDSWLSKIWGGVKGVIGL